MVRKEGHFAIASLPVGRYDVTWQVGERVLVEAGQETHVTLR